MAKRKSLNRQNQEMTLKSEEIFGLVKVTSFIVVMLNLEFSYMCQKKKHSIPLKYIDVVRSTHTDLDVVQEKEFDDYWNYDEDRKLSDSWTGFTKFTLLKETSKRIYVVRGETDKNSNNYSTSS